jgi:hypothetical protein
MSTWNARGHDGRAVYIPIPIWECRRCGARWNVAGQPVSDCLSAVTR